ncbi:uncharacterized protein LOC133800730 isoform X1 [Humulus lupulus]|uniref:uncharacterized protein LOC133800730 isoform X1 n=1 Tax=Humulus lupulus TaxID=3486 RepID=UPI002B40DA06|nr:uncharacterized protein LOC133800730 isoform X1 [Humulus lupulus]
MDDKGSEQLQSTILSHPMHKFDTPTPAGAYNGDGDLKNLYGVSDAEVLRYLNNNKVASYKRVIWETMNMDYQKEKNQKRAKTAKKAGSTKVVKSSQKINNEKKLSLKINYDMLNKLEQDEVLEMGTGEGMDSHHDHHYGSTLDDVKFNSEAYSSGETINDDDYQHEKLGSEEEDDAIEDYYAITDYGIDDDAYGHNEELDYEEH